MISVKKTIKIYYYIFFKIKLKFYRVQYGQNLRGNRVVLTNNGKIILGNNISLNLYPSGELIDNDLHRVSIDRYECMKAPICKAIYINDNVWVGANSLLLKGVRIGENAIVAAHSVVTKDIPRNTLFAGNSIDNLGEQNW